MCFDDCSVATNRDFFKCAVRTYFREGLFWIWKDVSYWLKPFPGVCFEQFLPVWPCNQRNVFTAKCCFSVSVTLQILPCCCFTRAIHTHASLLLWWYTTMLPRSHPFWQKTPVLLFRFCVARPCSFFAMACYGMTDSCSFVALAVPYKSFFSM